MKDDVEIVAGDPEDDEDEEEEKKSYDDEEDEDDDDEEEEETWRVSAGYFPLATPTPTLPHQGGGS